MKFIFMTDTHGRTNSPASRKDDFPNTILRKIEWCIKYANDNDAYVLHGGDWVNRPDTAATFIAKMSGILDCAKKPVIGVLGNHDIYGYNPQSFVRTPLSIVEACQSISIIKDSEVVNFYDGEVEVFVSGSSSTSLIDRNGRTDEYYTPRRDVPKAANEIRIHIVHGFLTNKDWPDGVPYTKINDILDTDADILLTGHEHTGFGIYPTGRGSVFCNPGALGRVSAAVGDVNRSVCIAEIDVFCENGKPTFNVSLVPLPETVALPADEVLDRERLEAEKKTAMQIEMFAEQIQQIEIDEPIIAPGQAVEQLNAILSQPQFEGIDITAEMRDLILDYVGKAEEADNEMREKFGTNTQQ